VVALAPARARAYDGRVRWLIALVCLVGLIQAVVWIGQPTAPASQRVLGVFAAPLAVVIFALALAATRVPALLF
jgi:hypothetical protein